MPEPKRDVVQMAEDYPLILAMHRVSLLINFGIIQLSEEVFKSSLIDAIERGGVTAYRADGELYGWLWLAFIGSERVHVRQIEVRRPYWGRGIGKAIMRDGIAIARERGYQEMTLNVTKSNQRAVNLYRGLGFAVVEDKGPRQLMRLALCPSPAPGQSLEPLLSPRQE